MGMPWTQMEVIEMKERLRYLLGWLLCLVVCLSVAGAVAQGEEGELCTVESGLIADGCLTIPGSTPGVVEKASDKTFAAYLLPKLGALETSIDVSHFRMDPMDFYQQYNRMLNMNPEYFYVNGGYTYYHRDGIITILMPNYRYPLSSIPNRVKKFEAAVDEVVAYASQSSTQVGQLLRTFDYFCGNFEYDLTYTNYRPDELFATGTGVCNAYTLAYGAVLNRLGFTHETTTSRAMNHIWNLVKVGGKWYHIDSTWGDPVPDMPLRVNHKNFLRSDAGITETGHYAWETGITASSTKYDNFCWQNAEQVLAIDGDTFYYVGRDFTNPNRTVYAYDLEENEKTTFYQYRYTTAGGYYADYNPVWVLDTEVFYATGHELYHASTVTGESKLVYSTGKGTTIWGIGLKGNTLKIYAAKGYSNEGKMHSYKLNFDYKIDISQDFVQLTQGKSRTLKYAITPVLELPVSISWSSENDSVSIAADGRLTAKKPGLTRVTATTPNGEADSCLVLVRDDAPLCPPSSTKVIDEDTFRNIGAMEIILPEGVERIESGAFAGCRKLRLLVLPDSLTYIAPDAFAGMPDTAYVLFDADDAMDSYADQYVLESGMRYFVMP